MNRKTAYRGKNLSLAFGFCVVVFIILFVYFAWKVFKVINQSRFDGHEYIVLVKEENNTQDLIAFLPDASAINLVTLHNVPENQSIASIAEIPVDAKVSTNALHSIASLMSKEIFSWGKGGMPLIDAIKLWFFTHSLPDGAVTTQAFSYPVTQEQLDNMIPRFFTDKVLYQDAQTIAVINASDVSGAGGRLAKFLTNIGANVIMVNTADNLQDISTIEYSGDNSYTLKKMQKIMNTNAKQTNNKNAVADITITLGKDKASNF
ncbi:MAG TPA: LytR C-terminal domain-containing protein [Patescibacteria group bacterium]